MKFDSRDYVKVDLTEVEYSYAKGKGADIKRSGNDIFLIKKSDLYLLFNC